MEEEELKCENTEVNECQRIRAAFERVERCFQNSCYERVHQFLLHTRSCHLLSCKCKEMLRKVNFQLAANFKPFPKFKDEQQLLIHVYHASKCLFTNCILKHCDEIKDVIKEYNTELLSQCCGKVRFSDTSWFNVNDTVAISTDYHIFCNYYIASGGFGQVYYQWLEKNNRDVAIAVKVTTSDIANELLIASIGQHSNLATPQLILEMPEQEVLIFMEKAECTLFDYVVRSNSLPVPVAVIFIKQILRALSFLHHNEIVHGDVKGQNIVLTNGMQKAQLIDFSGISRFNGDSRVNYTPGYAPTEVFIRNVGNSWSLDMYSFGIVVCEMFFGNMGMPGNMDRLEAIMLQRNQENVVKLNSICPAIAEFVEECISVIPSNRHPIKAEDILQQFQTNEQLQSYVNESTVVPYVDMRTKSRRQQNVERYLEKKLVCYMDSDLMKQLPPKVPYAPHAFDTFNWENNNEQL